MFITASQHVPTTQLKNTRSSGCRWGLRSHPPARLVRPTQGSGLPEPNNCSTNLPRPTHFCCAPSRLYGFGVCGTKQHHASGICFNWHPAWDAQALPGPWFRADAVLESGSLAGYHRICSNGSKVEPKLSNHMASAGDCCAPKFGSDAGSGLAGKMMWTRIYEHMLTDPIGTPPGPATPGESCACVGNTADRQQQPRVRSPA